jgi:hypothetical protein
MYFEIVGEISEIETIAQGRGVRRLKILRNDTAAGTGARKKAPPWFA